MTRSETDHTIETTQQSLDVLELAADRDGVTLRDVSTEFDVAKSTAYKHLTTLRERGLLTKQGETYHVGLALLNLGEHARSRWPGHPHIKSAIATLAEQTQEECDFVAPDRGRIITIAESYHKWAKYDDTASSGPSKEYRARIGSYYRMHATASGLAILATYPRSRVEEIIDRWGLPARTEYTITSRDALYDELAEIRERGYAVDSRGYAEGMRSIGKTVRRPDGSVIGALSVSGPIYRMDGAVLEEEIPRTLTEVAADLEAKLE
ncbi:IclR family transcriptional regulator [Haloarcula litorea]|uniref:IclR family transcriptional regulator n=1 Tax=Haloarcula litorea TaxID=3032579 RepID=UPI0023E8B722|nr:IclR family transcriptional regulator [Halomicroarcula sp. GDY20]